MFLASPPASDAADRVLQSTVPSMGFVMNLAHAWAWRPDVYEAFGALRGQLTSDSTLTKRDQAVIVCAVASQLGDAYCSLAWGKTLASVAGASASAAVIGDAEHADLTPRDRALAAWARQVVADPNGTTPAGIEALRAAGLDDRAIFEATVFAAFRLAFSTVNDALGAAPDRKLVASVPPEVAAAVTFGRTPQDAPAAG